MDTKIKIELDAQQANTSVKQLRQELKGVKDEMANLKEGSQAFNDAAKKAGELQHQITAINEAVRGASSDFGVMVGNIAKVGAGITGALQAAQGALNLFGVESENVTEAIKKMQSMMAITQGLSAIDSGIHALTNLRTSITSTTGAANLLKAALAPKTFLILTGVVTALSAVYSKLVGNSRELYEAEVKRNEAYKQAQLDKRTKEEKAIADALERQYTLQEKIYQIRFGGNDVKVYQALLADYKAQLNEIDAALKNQYNDEELLTKKREKRELEKQLKGLTVGSEEYLNTLLKITDKEQEINNVHPKSAEEVSRLQSRYDELTKKIEETNAALREALVIQEANAEASSILNQEAIDELDRQIAEQKALNDNEYDQKAAILELETKKLDYIKEGTLEYYNQLIAVKALKKELDESFNLRGEAVKLQTVEVENTDKLKDGTDRLHNAINNQQEAYQKGLRKNIQTQEEFKDGLNAAYLVGTVGFAALSDSLYAFAEMQDTTTKEGFEKNKKLQIAATVMNTLSSMVQALAGGNSMASQLGLAAPVGWALGAAQAAATAAMGAAQIVKIKQQQFNSSGSIGGASSGASRASINSSASRVIAPVQYTQDVQGSKLEDTIKSSRVYVTESDITNTQRKVNVAESESRF